jgi:hypothetical protein
MRRQRRSEAGCPVRVLSLSFAYLYRLRAEASKASIEHGPSVGSTIGVSLRAALSISTRLIEL